MNIEPQHIRVKKGAIGRAVVVAGDPERVVFISHFLSRPRVVNRHRFLVYTGYYKGKKVSIASHGIGMPSMSIAVEELHALGAQTIIRLGTAGGVAEDLVYGDVVLPTYAESTPGGTIGEYLGRSKKRFFPDAKLMRDLSKNLEKEGIKSRYGGIFSSNAFYAEGKISKKYTAVEMECAALFALAKLRNFRAGAALVISDSITNKEMSRMLNSTEMSCYLSSATKAVLGTLSMYA